MYYQFKKKIYDDYGAKSDPDIPWNVSFLKGEVLQQNFDVPLIVAVNNPSNDPPRGISGITVPVFSAPLVEVFQKSGVDNMQLFDAVLVNEGTAQRWANYSAVNIIGLISCADLTKSQATKIAQRPGDSTPLYNFHQLVIDPSAIHGQLLFRLAEQPSMIIVHQKLVDALFENPNPNADDWGVSCFPLEES